jgi:hypothetical protein
VWGSNDGASGVVFWSDGFLYVNNQFYWLVDERGVDVVGNDNGWREKTKYNVT